MSQGPLHSTAAERDARRYIDRIVRGSRSSFYWAMRTLPEPRRGAMFALYAFCRIVDDIADGDGASAHKIAQLEDWRDRVDQLFRGAPNHPVTLGLSLAVDAYALDKADFVALIDAMELDAAPRVRLEDDRALDLYCDRVAGTVGRLSNAIFGVPNDTARRLAGTLGTALQITNILRDLKEDAKRNRLYLPLETLRTYMPKGAGDAHAFDDPLSVLADPSVTAMLDGLALRAQALFVQSDDLLARLPRNQALAPRMMKAFYQRVLTRMVRRGWRRWDTPPRLGTMEKTWIVMQGLS
ncbi:presqualene diphosphate synthase HpnD [Varunaivibrio sulfuroxidans]|nr:presqualene diphosphate synthase HpnD [Varunaivibrio sulfuroxidans]WES31027.1 presqualene diphosphate synthase HpnD [Varunaivibrio sulfuroxidans]